jgi:Double zinc ribbon
MKIPLIISSTALLMPDCPRCHQKVDLQAIVCPYCRTTLKAFGHPGIPLHQAGGKEYLCSTCTYHADDTCNFPQRPFARECTLYQNQAQQMVEPYTPHPLRLWQGWLRRNAAWIILVSLVVISILLALSNR